MDLPWFFTHIELIHLVFFYSLWNNWTTNQLTCWCDKKSTEKIDTTGHLTISNYWDKLTRPCESPSAYLHGQLTILSFVAVIFYFKTYTLKMIPDSSLPKSFKKFKRIFQVVEAKGKLYSIKKQTEPCCIYPFVYSHQPANK